ncbi:hypothetical protein PR048_023034 [Dryococelus australis]|uniref:Uncharacterized protein n=1 Tax=Dryococelus australis TaxID=614101 RepID=A0ABQ9GSY4_9NEOP|nr:hypothetical protein PR048_023034 [Dryococelus australis]
MVAQSESKAWHDKIQGRSTSSNFGVVCRRKDPTPCCNLVKRLLYKPDILKHQLCSMASIMNTSLLSASRYGIFVDLEHGYLYLGARPGCLVREESALAEDVRQYLKTARSTEHNWAPILLFCGNDRHSGKSSYRKISADESLWRQEMTPKR